ncbi:MAG: twin-arginine translocase TatA/TatE family subunit [Naasia sp.]
MGIFGNTFSGWHLIAVLAIVLLLFGAPKLPALAKSIGQSMKILKTEIKTDKDETEKRDAEATTVYTAEPPAGTPVTGASEPDSRTEK